jgi:Protein of unknown function (DUF2652)
MAIRRAVLLIADIGGYTRYMNWNRLHLTHAQQTVALLLESVIDAGKGLKLAKLEGDAAFFWAPDGNANVLVGDRPASTSSWCTECSRTRCPCRSTC